MTSAIKIENLTKYYGKFKALSSLNLEVDTNTIYAFIDIVQYIISGQLPFRF